VEQPALDKVVFTHVRFIAIAWIFLSFGFARLFAASLDLVYPDNN
jgi:hypothetical protein